MTTWFIIDFIALSLLVVHFSSNVRIWFLALLAYLLCCHHLIGNEVSSGVFVTITTITVLFAIVLVIPFVRRLLISRNIYRFVGSKMPTISETENLALNAGDAWFEKELFQGRPNYNTLHNIKRFSLSEEEQSFLDNETSELCALLNEWHINKVEHDLSKEAWDFIRSKGFLGLVIPKEYGGKGFSASAHSQIVLKIATRSASAAVTVMVPNSLGPGELLYHYGTEAQKNYYLPRLACGDEIPCFALTSVHAGSDATSIIDQGIVCMGNYQNQEVLGIRLKQVNKRYITLAPIATLVGLAIKLEDPHGLLGANGREGITCVLLPHDYPGLEIGNRLLPLDQAFMNGTIRIEDTFIPIDFIIGGQKMAGEGWRMLVECLSIGRAISLPSTGVASAVFSTVMSSAYAQIREQFKVPIGNFEGVEEVLARMSGLSYMANAARELTVVAIDSQVRPSVASAIAKYHLTETGRTVLNHALDVHGGRGIIMGPNNYLAIAYQSLPISITVEGANIMTRNLMIFGQGAMRCHPYVRQEYEALASADVCAGVKLFDQALIGHIGYLLNNRVRAWFHALTMGVFAPGFKASCFHRYYKQISLLSNILASMSDIMLLLLGGEFKRKERLSARMGDCLSYLYMASATLKHFRDNGEEDSDKIFVRWSLEHCLHCAEEALFDVINNFNKPHFVARLFKIAFFPYGRRFKKPTDCLEHQIAQSMLSNSKTREKFKQMCYLHEDMSDVAGKMEVTFKQLLTVAPIKTKIRKAIKERLLPRKSVNDVATKALELGIITQDELKSLQLSAHYVNIALQVDEFKPYELGPKNAHPNWQ